MGPYVLPRTPLPYAVESSPAVRRVVAELNFIQTIKRRLNPLRPAFQVILPDARLDFFADPDMTLRELDREFPDERLAFDQFLGRAQEISQVLEPVLGQDVLLPPDGFFERREIGRSEGRVAAPDEDVLPGLPEGHPLRALVDAPGRARRWGAIRAHSAQRRSCAASTCGAAAARGSRGASTRCAG